MIAEAAPHGAAKLEGVQALANAGDPNGVPCTAQFDGARPDGPGSGFQCRFVNSLHADLTMLPSSIGMCVDIEQFGDCRSCDLAMPELCPPGCLPFDPREL